MKARRAVYAATAAALIPLLAACGDDAKDSGGPDVPQSEAPQGAKHGPAFPECGGISDEVIAQQTRLTGLVNTAKTSVGCQWLAGGRIDGPHFSFNWYRGSPIGRERKTEELTRTSVQDINIEGHDGFIAYSDSPVLGVSLCEVGIQFDDDFIEWSVSFDAQPFPDACEVVKELTRQSIVNAK